MSVPTFRVDAKAFGDELTAVLAAPFPPEDNGLSCGEQAQTDGLTYVQRLERVASMVAGEQRRVLAETAAVAPEVRFPFPGAAWTEWSLHGEVAALLQVAAGTAESRIENARRLHDVLPATLRKLRAGELSVAKTIVMLEETVNLDPPEAARVDAGAMKKTAGTPTQFRARVRGLIAKIDPEAVIRRRKKAREEQVGVYTYEGEDGLNAINALIPTEDAARGWAAIVARAKELRVSGDARSVDELRAAAFIDLLVNRPDGTPRVTVQVQALVPVGTLLGISNEDGHIPGHGPISAETARDLADQAGCVQRSLIDPETGALVDATITGYRPRLLKPTRILQPTDREVLDLIAADPQWQRLLGDPDTSHLLDAHPDRYRPGDPLERFIKLRDQHCRFPGCRRPAKFCDVDHTIPHGRMGGLTIRRNLACFCRRHHQIKQLPGWKLAQGDHGELSFTTPSGRIYRTRPPNPDGSDPPLEIL